MLCYRLMRGKLYHWIKRRKCSITFVTSDNASYRPIAESKPEDQAKVEDKETILDPALAVKSDPYLKMLQQRSLRSAGPVVARDDKAGLSKHPNNAYIAPTEVPYYAQVKPKYKPRWQVGEGEIFEQTCTCGVKHDAEKMGKKASLMLHTIAP